MNDHGHLPDDLAGIARRLEAERPTPTGEELERVRQRATGAGAGSTHTRKGTVGTTMKPRLAILSMLAAGILLMGTGTGLALSGISSSENAGVAQYPTTTTTPTGGVAGQQGGGGVGGLKDTGGGAAGEARQVAATSDGSTLPFTGFAAIPIIVVGAGLLVGGLLIRRRSSTA